MNKRLVRALAICLAVVGSCAMLFAIAYALNPSNTNLVGTWNNVDGAGGIAQIIIADDGAGGITVHAFGNCAPDPCDWGTVPGVAYSTSIRDSEGRFFTAIYNFGFNSTILTGEVQNDGRLVVHSYNEFNDETDRYNSHFVDTFQQ